MRRNLTLLRVLIGLAAIVGVIALALFVTRHEPDTPGGSPGSASGTATGVTGSNPVWLIVLENHSYGQIIGSGSAPFLNTLANRYGLATDYHAVGRPSQPNYLALVSGSTQGVSDDGVHDVTATTLFDQLEAAHRSWRVFAENVPAGCFTGASSSGGQDGPGTYVRKHEPAISFTSISASPQRCAQITNLSSFDPAAADFNLIVPNLCHDMHDCSVRQGDAWLSQFVPRITDSAAFRDGGLLVIVFDEAKSGDDAQHTVLVFARASLAAGTRATGRATHYSLLRALEELWGLPCLASSCDAQAIPELLPGY